MVSLKTFWNSILGPLLLSIYINDLSDGVPSNCKLFADDTSLFPVVNDIQSSAAILRNDIMIISNWAIQWKMIFNPVFTKQKQEVIFSRKTKKLLHSCLSFNDVSLKNSKSQKHRKFCWAHKKITQKISKRMDLFYQGNPYRYDHI